MTAMTPSVPLRVLVVDDEALARSRLRTLLGDCKAPATQRVAEAASAIQAMNLLRHEHFDVALLDIQLPGMDGLKLARSLQVAAHAPALIFVTASSSFRVTSRM